jgi:hypothetical protein
MMAHRIKMEMVRYSMRALMNQKELMGVLQAYFLSFSIINGSSVQDRGRRLGGLQQHRIATDGKHRIAIHLGRE